MKKLLMACLLALGVTMACEQKASAWSEFKFSAGVNLGWVGGGNRILWGAYHSAPYPGGQDVYPVFPGVAAALGYNAANAGFAPAGGGFETAPLAPMPAAGGGHAYNPYYNTGYQPVGYYPDYSAYQQAPSYWYGR